jgi:hypothetical protein
MKERSEIMENIRKKKEWYEDHAAKIGVFKSFCK